MMETFCKILELGRKCVGWLLLIFLSIFLSCILLTSFSKRCGRSDVEMVQHEEPLKVEDLGNGTYKTTIYDYCNNRVDCKKIFDLIEEESMNSYITYTSKVNIYDTDKNKAIIDEISRIKQVMRKSSCFTKDEISVEINRVKEKNKAFLSLGCTDEFFEELKERHLKEKYLEMVRGGRSYREEYLEKYKKEKGVFITLEIKGENIIPEKFRKKELIDDYSSLFLEYKGYDIISYFTFTDGTKVKLYGYRKKCGHELEYFMWLNGDEHKFMSKDIAEIHIINGQETSIPIVLSKENRDYIKSSLKLLYQ